MGNKTMRYILPFALLLAATMSGCARCDQCASIGAAQDAGAELIEVMQRGSDKKSIERIMNNLNTKDAYTRELIIFKINNSFADIDNRAAAARVVANYIDPFETTEGSNSCTRSPVAKAFMDGSAFNRSSRTHIIKVLSYCIKYGNDDDVAESLSYFDSKYGIPAEGRSELINVASEKKRYKTIAFLSNDKNAVGVAAAAAGDIDALRNMAGTTAFSASDVVKVLSAYKPRLSEPELAKKYAQSVGGKIFTVAPSSVYEAHEKSKDYEKVIVTLAQNGAKLPSKNESLAQILRVLVLDKKYDSVSSILKAGASPDASVNGVSLLSIALNNNIPNAAMILLESGATIPSNGKDSLFFVAVDNNMQDVVAYLLRKNIKLPDMYGLADEEVNLTNIKQARYWLEKADKFAPNTIRHNKTLAAIQALENEWYPISSMLNAAIAGDATHWTFNTFDYGSVSLNKVKSRHQNKSIETVRANYTYNSGRTGWVDATFDQRGNISCITFHDYPNTCRTVRESKGTLAARRSGDFEMYYGQPEFKKSETIWRASCKDGGSAWVTKPHDSNVYSWSGMGFSASSGGADYNLTVEQMLRKACKGG